MSTDQTKLEKQIIATVVYYDILNYPLTGFEIFSYLIKGNINVISSLLNHNVLQQDQNDNKKLEIVNLKLSDIIETLDTNEFLKNNLDQKLGFYFLKGREEIVQERSDRKKIWDKKWKKSKRIFWIMQIAPFSRLVMGSGSFSLGNTRKDSDIDLMIVAKKGK
ncbi:MAG: hypothetical protein KAS78_01580, partial [Candidatus Pacebacteria bacterium]|nr:hypothetical protein [Candidatus Paceibacterota bacterium]